ncbi:hypothetical protein MFUL124B02_11490 [Myxococcus fulvus 124B02]|nr:hypothetical protein MFUL124B02_11490 [Myxococcus fulvus 124B02]
MFVACGDGVGLEPRLPLTAPSPALTMPLIEGDDAIATGGSISGTLTFTQHEGPPDSEFASLVGKSVPFVIRFETPRVVREGGGPKAISVETGPIAVQFSGPDGALLQEHVSPFFEGQSFLFRVTNLPDGYQVLSTFLIEGVGSGTPLDFVSHESQPFMGTMDPGGYPEATPFEFQSTMVFSLHAFGDLGGTFSGTVVPR